MAQAQMHSSVAQGLFRQKTISDIEFSHIAVLYKLIATGEVRITDNVCIQKGSNTGAEGIKIDFGTRCLIARNFVKMLPCLAGITFESGTQHTRCADNLIWITGNGYGIRIENADSPAYPIMSLYVQSNTILGTGNTWGIYQGAADNRDILIQSNQLDGAGINAWGRRVRILGNQIVNVPSLEAIKIAAQDSEVLGNTVRGCSSGIAADGASVTPAPNLTISGNVITEVASGGKGIRLTRYSNAVIKDNVVQSANALLAGIWVYGNGAGDTGATFLEHNHVHAPSASHAIRIEYVNGVESHRNYLKAASRYHLAVTDAVTSDRRLMLDAAAVPASGKWEAGDRVYFTAPVPGGSIGAVCVAGGTPGTWKGFGSISP